MTRQAKRGRVRRGGDMRGEDGWGGEREWKETEGREMSMKVR